jgi:hypothetical protein
MPSSSTNCPLSSLVIGHTRYVKNCYYEIGVNTVNGEVSYAAITDGSNKSVAAQAGLLAEELDDGIGGVGHFTSAKVSINTKTLPGYVEEGISGETVSSTTGAEILSGTVNLTFFADEPYFVASLNSTIETVGPHNSHDVANYVSKNWNKAWVGPGNNGTLEVCITAGCTHYAKPESTFDTSPDIRSLLQRNGPTWGWLGNTSSTSKAEGIGFLVLGWNSTSPNEAAITHYEVKQIDFEIEGTGIGPADPTSDKIAPHALQYSSNVPQKMYGAVLVYLNDSSYARFYNFIQGLWKSAVVGSFLGSSSSYAAFAETSVRPNLKDDQWYITNLVTSVSAPQSSSTNGMIFFTGRNSSLANDFPMKMYLNLNSSDSVDSNFKTYKTTLISNDGTNAKVLVVWNDTKNGLVMAMNFSTKSNSDIINVTGYVQVTGASLKAKSLSLQENLYANYLDGVGLPTTSSSDSKLSWNYTNVGIAMLLPTSSDFVKITSSPSSGYLYLVNSGSAKTYLKGSSFPFRFAVSLYDPLSNFSPQYTENIYVPTLKFFTQPLGNASQVGFPADNARVFSYLLSATQFYSNRTIAAIQFIKPFSADLEVYYGGSVNSSVYVKFSNGTTDAASSFYNSQSRTFNFDVATITSASLYVT